MMIAKMYFSCITAFWLGSTILIRPVFSFSIGNTFPTTTTTTTTLWSASSDIDKNVHIVAAHDNVEDAAATTTTTTVGNISIEPKEAVKLFGRLAEKYIMLDESGGMCCYSACKDCEFRLPDGGYKMADQSAARPKWIPIYEGRAFEALDKSHTSKWSSEIFTNGPAVTKDEFVMAMKEMNYAPPLGGPFVAASGGSIEDTTATEVLFDILADGKEKLARHKMSVKLKELSDGEQGLTWPRFSSALGL